MFFHWIKGLFKPRKDEIPRSLPMPADWQMTLADLEKEKLEGNRSTITNNEFNWARQYEREQNRSKFRFPRRGDLYQTRFDQNLTYSVDLSGVPAGVYGSLNIAAGEQFWVSSDPTEDEPFGANLIPVAFKKIEAMIIPEQEISGIQYTGFDFYISTPDLNEKFDLIQTDYYQPRAR